MNLEPLRENLSASGPRKDILVEATEQQTVLSVLDGTLRRIGGFRIILINDTLDEHDLFCTLLRVFIGGIPAVGLCDGTAGL